MSDPCRIALVGDGIIADQHARALASVGASVAVVVGVEEEKVSRFAADHGIEAWSTQFEAALEDSQISGVVVASPNQMHVPQTLAALAAGKHVLCEVPLATSLADARRVVDKVAETGLVCTVGQSNRHVPLLAQLRRSVEAGELEPLQLVGVTALMRRRDHNVGMDGRPRDWVDSVIWHHGSHAVDTALWLLNDRVDHVQAATGSPDRTDGRPLDVSIMLETAAGRLAVLTLSYNSHQSIAETILITRDETYRLSDLVPRQAGESDGRTPASKATAAIGEALRSQDGAFLASVEKGVPASPTPEELLPMVEILDQVERQVQRRLEQLISGSDN